MGAQVRKSLRLILLATVVLVVTCIDPNARVASHGSFSTSDFKITWPDRWHVVQETESNLVLSDGITNVHVVGILDTQSPELSVPELVYDWFTFVIAGEDIVETVPVTALGPDRAFAVHTYRYRVDDQRLDPYAVYFEARRVTAEVLLWLVVDTHLGLYRADPGVFDAIIASLQVDEAATSPPAQSFVSGPWHIALPSVNIAQSIPSLGLSSVPGHKWVVMLTDIANGGDTAISFPVDSAVIETESGSQFVPSQIDSYVVSSALQLADPISAPASLPPGTLVRIALVYLVPSEEFGLKFVVADHGISVDALIDSALGVASLPPQPRMPMLVRGVIAEWTDSNGVRVRMDDGSIHEISLLGARLPTQSDCFGQEASAYLQSLVGKRVAIEHDPAVLSNGQAYLWIDEALGAPSLINYQVLALGFAKVVAIPQDARFSMWLQQTDEVAQQQRAGQWAVCQ